MPPPNRPAPPGSVRASDQRRPPAPVILGAALLALALLLSGCADDDLAKGSSVSAVGQATDGLSSSTETSATTDPPNPTDAPDTSGDQTATSATTDPPNPTDAPDTSGGQTATSATTDPPAPTDVPDTTGGGQSESSATSQETTPDSQSRRRTFRAPASMIWADLPETILMNPPSAPRPTFTSESPGICSVTSGGEVKTPSIYDGKKGTCNIRVAAPATSDWDAVNELVTIELTGPPVIVRATDTIDRAPDWPAGNATMTVTLGFSVTNSYNVGLVEVKAAPCSAADSITGGTLTVTLTFSSPDPCTVTFSHFASGVFEVALDVPVGLTIDPKDPPSSSEPDPPPSTPGTDPTTTSPTTTTDDSAANGGG